MLLRLLAAPVTAPLRGILWISEYAVDEAYKRRRAEIQEELESLAAARAAGTIEDDDATAREDTLLQELSAIRAHQASNERQH